MGVKGIRWTEESKLRFKKIARKRERLKKLKFSFESFIYPEPNTGCWLWAGWHDKNGYGRFEQILAHRFSFKKYNGRLSKNLCVLHHCDVPACVNPQHLYKGTMADNARDRDTRGRNYWSKINQQHDKETV